MSIIDEYVDTQAPALRFEVNGNKRCSKYAMTAALVFSWICLGLYAEILGPTLPTLMYQTGANYAQVGFALSLRSVGLLVGSLIGGWMADHCMRMRVMQLIASLLLAALVNIPIPWTRSLPALSAVFWAAGFSHGSLTTSGNPLLGSIWGPQAAAPFSIMHAGYGLGAAMTSVLASLFCFPHNSSVNSLNGAVYVIPLLSNSTDSVIIDPVPPYTFTAVLLVLCALCFLPFAGLNRSMAACFSDKSPLKTWSRTHNVPPGLDNRQKLSTTRHIPGKLCALLKHRMVSTFKSTSFKIIQMFLCIFIMYFAIVGNERVFGKFMFTYAIYGPVRMASHNGYLLNLLYWIFFGLARVLTCFLALVIPSNVTLVIVVLGTLFASIGLVVIPPTETWFFVFTCLFSLFKSPLFPATLAAVNRSYEITGMIVLVVNLGSACGAGLLQFTAGALIDKYGQDAFPYLVCGSACVVLVTSTLLLLILRSIGDRFANDSPSHVPDHGNSDILVDFQPPDEKKSCLSKEQNHL